MKHIGFNAIHKLNQKGLDSATKSYNKISIQGDTMFVAGTSNLQDLWDDF